MPDNVYVPDPPTSKCGRVENGGIYIRGIGGGGWGGGKDGLQPQITPIWPPAGDKSAIVTGSTKRATLRLVDGDAILAHRPESEWLIGSSRTARAEKEWQDSAVEVFGMPIAERLAHGACEGMDLTSAMSYLAGRKISENGWHDLKVYIQRIGARTVANDGLHSITLRMVTAWKSRQPAAILARLHELMRQPKTGDVRTFILMAMRIIAVEDYLWQEVSLATK